MAASFWESGRRGATIVCNNMMKKIDNVVDIDKAGGNNISEKTASMDLE